MTVTPWRLIARPHHDVLAGTFKQAEFAADISRVAEGTAEHEYQDAEQFFKRTYITEGMRDLLISVAQRLAGRGGDPVIQLQTNFGGGKTHTLLAVYHLATQGVNTQQMEGIPALLDDAGIMELPKARVAVIDGISLSPNQPIIREGTAIRTMWGLWAYSLLGGEGYDMVAESDRSGTAPGKEIIIELLRKAAPCVVLMDELVSFLRQLEEGKMLTAGTLAANMSFIQALTEGMKAVPNAMLLASLPESDTETVGSQGKNVLTTLEKYFGRVESVWKPVAQNESFEIVRRRLFDTTGVESEVEEVCRAFAEYYRSHKEKLPADVQESRYYDKMRRSYPIHPEVFDRLYEDWSTLDKFQRTRGVLQYMAIIIHRLWQDNDQDPMIMPGTLPLHDIQVRVKSTQYLPQGWDVVITKEIDGEDSQSAAIEKEQRFGAIHAAHRAARTIFLGSAPSNAAQSARGILKERILLGCARPGDDLAVYEDVFKRLRDRLHYLFSNEDRYWFDTHPNLRREMEARKGQIDRGQIAETLKKVMEAQMGRNSFFSALHVFTRIDDIPDEIGNGVRLVLLPPETTSSYSKANSQNAIQYINMVLGGGIPGQQPFKDTKQRIYKNRVLFLAPDAGVIARVIDQCRTYLAWCEICSDVDNGRLNLDTIQTKDVQKQKSSAHLSLGNIIKECYKHLIVPTAENDRDVRMETYVVTSQGGKLADAVRDIVLNNEIVVKQYSPVLLKQVLDKYYFAKGRTEVHLDELWKDMCKYYYFQRLHDVEVLHLAVIDGVKDALFGYAVGKEDDRYIEFAYSVSPASVYTDSSAIIINKDEAKRYQAKLEAEKISKTSIYASSSEKNDGIAYKTDTQTVTASIVGRENEQTYKRRYYGRKELDVYNPEGDLHEIVKEIVTHFTKMNNVKVGLHLEIDVSITDSSHFEAPLIRTVMENSIVLKLNESDFQEQV